ncbi:uroporphyrinogen-III C-methyltransferase [Chitinophaga varians]|uniref:uroporphyrinogen-III C-methyltransferase n=1 Tax=Chitinophaga varians TaxID=2202339 RepID=UPI00165F03E0|nr:uroporphyrinogen-III C-methyltransferase [Chitinophaga varians]MBC9912994.1 uroporphyrinogen-III C-methyltransferase [Chitinophaga varians]
MKLPFLSLVGAGPGDPELITLKAIHTLRQADVVLYDALVNPLLLEYAPAQAIRQFVGKRCGSHSLPQEEINRLMVEMAQQHGHVVRLKGGDPFVFGRAVEEIMTAQQHHIGVAVIPGISSAIAVPASQLIPVTCRGVAESFWVTTGTTCAGQLSGDIALAAQSTATVVILMGMHHLEAILQIFTHHGKQHTPAAIIQEGTTPQARIVTGTVSDIHRRAQEAGISHPAIIVIGEVVSLQLPS